MRVLVMEEDSKIASFVVTGLKQNGFAVDSASEGENGLALAEAVSYDAAVLDIMLPKLDGLSLLRQMRQHKILTRPSQTSSLRWSRNQKRNNPTETLAAGAERAMRRAAGCLAASQERDGHWCARLTADSPQRLPEINRQFH